MQSHEDTNVTSSLDMDESVSSNVLDQLSLSGLSVSEMDDALGM